MNIKQIPSPNFAVGRGSQKPEVIVIHIMAGTLIGTDSHFSSPSSQVSTHYGIGLNGEVHQYVKEEDTAWGNGLRVPPINKAPTFKLYKPGLNPNSYTISIEHEGQDLNNGTEQMFASSVELIQSIAKRWNIPIDRDHIIGHYEIDPTRKPNCPGVDKSIMNKLVARAKGPSKPTKQEVIAKLQEAIKLVESL